MDQVDIPEHIDSPMQFLLWEADEVLPIGVLMIIGVATHTLSFMWIAMYFVWKIYVRFKERHLLGYLLHFSYRYLTLPLNRRFNNGSITLYHQ